MALVTLADVKIFLGISGSTKDALLNLLIDQASTLIESLCDVTFSSTAYTELIDGNGTREILLRHSPVITFTSLEKRTAFDNTDSWETIATSDYWVETDSGKVTKTSSYADWDVVHKDPSLSDEMTFDYGKQNYRATYTAGYATIPNDIQMAVMTVISSFYNTSSKMGIKSETLGDRTLNLGEGSSDVTKLPSVQTIINKYSYPSI